MNSVGCSKACRRLQLARGPRGNHKLDRFVCQQKVFFVRKNMSSRPPPQVKKMKSFGFVGPNGSATWALFPAEATAVQIAERIANEAGGQNWPLKIEGRNVQDFDFSGAKDKIYDITWAPSKGKYWIWQLF